MGAMGLGAGHGLTKGHPYAEVRPESPGDPLFLSPTLPIPVPCATSDFFCFRFFPPFRSSTADWLRPKPAPSLSLLLNSGHERGRGQSGRWAPAVGGLRAGPTPPQRSRESRARCVPFSAARGQGDIPAAHARTLKACPGERQAYCSCAVKRALEERNGQRSVIQIWRMRPIAG